jgi:redox-sensitive bicupin YhaK (pirin superfamily)
MQDPLGNVLLVIDPPARDLGDGFTVRRALPNPQQRMLGPFVFLDQMGPHAFAPGTGLDVRPHPHIGLATLTYLFDGEILHRDSLGTALAIRPGAVNWMTAGRGIVHSERTAPEHRAAGSRLFGLQCWVGLPQAQEEAAPSFVHLEADALPVVVRDGARMTIVAGEFFGARSPVPILSPLFFVDVQLDAGATLTIPAEYAQQGIQTVAGDVAVDGVGQACGRLLALAPGATVTLQARSAARVVLLGGAPLDGPRAISWNFVASSQQRLDRAADDWSAGRFPAVPGETESIPLPPAAGRPVFYP